MRLIDADAFLAGEIKRCHCVPLIGSCERDYEPLTCILDQEPPIDAVPVVRGRWILHHTVTGNPYTECSNCCTNVAVKTDKGTFAKLDMRGMPYCPFCSAKMDGGFDDATS